MGVAEDVQETLPLVEVIWITPEVLGVLIPISVFLKLYIFGREGGAQAQPEHSLSVLKSTLNQQVSDWSLLVT